MLVYLFFNCVTVFTSIHIHKIRYNIIISLKELDVKVLCTMISQNYTYFKSV